MLYTVATAAIVAEVATVLKPRFSLLLPGAKEELRISFAKFVKRLDLESNPS